MMKDGPMIQDRDLQRLDGLHYFLNGKWEMAGHYVAPQISLQSK